MTKFRVQCTKKKIQVKMLRDINLMIYHMLKIINKYLLIKMFILR